MIDWLRKYWPFLALGIGGVVVLIYIRQRRADTTGTNQLAATLPVWGSGGGGVMFEPAQQTPPVYTQPTAPSQLPGLPSPTDPGYLDYWQGRPPGYPEPPPPSTQAPPGPIGSGILGQPLVYVPDSPSIMAIQVESGYEVG